MTEWDLLHAEACDTTRLLTRWQADVSILIDEIYNGLQAQGGSNSEIMARNTDAEHKTPNGSEGL